ncbi:MAG: PAS domain S-box protein [Bacteroidota bacterium]
MSDKSQTIRILFAEDLPEDVELARREIKKRDIKFTAKVVDTEPEFVKALHDFHPDIVISDYSMPTFDGMQALKITRKSQIHIPFIILTGSMNEETAVECMKSGADDYVIKEQIARLPFAIREVIGKVRAKREKEWLQHLMLKVSRLSVKEIGLNDFLKGIHREIKKIMKADNFTIVLYDESSGKYTIPYHADEYDDLTTNKPISLENTLTDYVRKTGKAQLVTEESERNLKEKAKIKLMGTPSPLWLGAPVKDTSPDRVSGVIVLQDYKDESAYDQSDLNLLEIIASEIGIFINRKRDHEKLKQSEEKFRGLFREHSAVKLIINPANGAITEANNAAADFYGWTVEELEQMNIFQINTLPPNKINEEMEHALENRKTIFEFKHRKADGSICNVEVFGSRVQMEGKAYIHSIVHDISEKKKVEEKFKLISRSVEQSPVSIVITDANGMIEYTNPAFNQISGYSFEEVKGKNPRILQSGEHSKDFYKELWDTILAGRDWKGEFHDKKKNGELYWEQAEISPIIDENGEITHFVGIKEDITEKKKVFEDLKAAKEKAEESDRLKTAFLANMSHEIRTPMNGILGFADILKDSDFTSEEKDEYIEVIHRSGQRLMNTVSDIVEISKIEAGIVNIERQETNLNPPLEEIINFFRPEAQKKGLKINLDKLLPENQSAIITDKHKFEAILTNLVENAIKYTDEGQINVGADIKNDWVEFYVKDTGIGVPKHRQKAIFNRFEQADISDTRAFEGSGLGLAISKSYIEMLGGKIWLESEENKGSVFYFTLPVKKAKTAATSTDPAKSNNQPNTETPGKKLKVLVAEDDADSFMYLNTILKKNDWHIIHTVTGRETIEKYREQPDVDLILMDIKLPDIDGYEATRQIKEINPEVPIIAQTANAMGGDRQKALEAGCDEYISKPIRKKTLLNLVDEVLNP